MALAKYVPSTTQPTKPELPKTGPDDYKGIVVDDKYGELHALTQYVEGYPLTVDFYAQILGENNSPREIDVGQSGVYQQYSKINHLDIRVDQPLNHTYNEETGLSDIRGSANIYPAVQPNNFDYFTTRLTRGRIGLFRITNVRRLSLNRDSVNNVEYQFVGYADQGDAKTFLENLEEKVKREYYFSGDRLAEGSSPILKKEEHEAADNLYKDARNITEYYLETFFNRSYCTLVVPGQTQAVYDKYMTDYVVRIISTEDCPTLPHIKQLGSDQDRYMNQPQFWKAIAERNPLYILQSNRFMGLTNRGNFNKSNWIAGAGMSTIDSYIYPVMVDNSVRLPNDPFPMIAGPGLSDTTPAGSNICARGNNSFDDGTGTSIPLYKRVLVDPYYVLSRDFYDTQKNWCLLEKMTWDYLEGRMIQLNELLALTKQYYSLARLEQFYYGPLILTFIKESRYTQYTER